MKFRIHLLILFLLVLVLSFVYGAGDSTIPSNDNDTDSNETEINDIDNNYTEMNETMKDKRKRRNCEVVNDRKGRIKCRLNETEREEYEISDNRPPEACKLANNRGHCVSLYRVSQKCYDLEGRNKDKCFKRVSGFAKAKIHDERNQTSIRNHLVLLLYDLQERLEEDNDNDGISDDDAAVLIDKIIEVKELILNDGTRREVKVAVKELREMWRVTAGGVE